MPDMLVSLVDLPPLAPRLAPLRARGVTLRRPHPWEAPALRAFVAAHFPEAPGWPDEAAVAFAHQPVSAFVALSQGSEIVGFAAYECTRRNYFGPTGVAPTWRGGGLGAALTLAGLIGLREIGYAYAIIGGAGPVEFYRKLTGAIPIPFRDGRGIYDIIEEPGLDG